MWSEEKSRLTSRFMLSLGYGINGGKQRLLLFVHLRVQAGKMCVRSGC